MITKNDLALLNSVVTLPEASRRWNKAVNTIRLAIDKNHIAAIKEGRMWKISVPSLIRHWGQPTN